DACRSRPCFPRSSARLRSWARPCCSPDRARAAYRRSKRACPSGSWPWPRRSRSAPAARRPPSSPVPAASSGSGAPRRDCPPRRRAKRSPGPVRPRRPRRSDQLDTCSFQRFPGAAGACRRTSIIGIRRACPIGDGAAPGRGCLDACKQPSSPKNPGLREAAMRGMLRSAWAAVGLALLAGGPVGAAGPALSIQTLSSRPQFVTGGDALVEVRGATRGVTLSLNGKDVTGDLQLDRQSHTLRGLVSDMALGKNTLAARAGAAKATLTVTNYPISGPILSGPHMQPYECRTEESGLGKPLDADCSAAERTDWFYRTTGGAFKPLASRAERPADLATTT